MLRITIKTICISLLAPALILTCIVFSLNDMLVNYIALPLSPNACKNLLPLSLMS